MKSFVIVLLLVTTICFGFVAVTTTNENRILREKNELLKQEGQNAVVISPLATPNEIELAFQKILTITQRSSRGDLWLGLQRGDELTVEFFQTMLPLSGGNIRVFQSEERPRLLQDTYPPNVIRTLTTKSTWAGSSLYPLKQGDTKIGVTIDGDACTNRK